MRMQSRTPSRVAGSITMNRAEIHCDRSVDDEARAPRVISLLSAPALSQAARPAGAANCRSIAR